MKYVLIDERMRDIEKDKLKELGYELIKIKQSEEVYTEISSHVDIFACKIENKIIIEPTQYVVLPKLKSFEQGIDNIEAEYPFDIKYNVCTIGKIAIHNFKYTDKKIQQELIKSGYELIQTTQGYTNCSIAVIDDKSAIVTDEGLYKILQNQNIDVLFLKNELDIKLLRTIGYSNKNGFIGGAISKIGDNIIVFGDLSKIDKENQIRSFIEDRNLNIIEFKGLDVIDYGGIIEFEEGNENANRN